MKISSWLAPAAIACAIFVAASADATTCTSDRYGSFSIGSYIFNNDKWNNSAGAQTICANSANNFYINSNQPNTSGVKAYGDVQYNIGRSISSIHTLKSSFNQSTPSSGTWDYAYDIWDNNSSHEIMIWSNWQNTQPIAKSYSASGAAVPTYSNVNVGGSTWNVYEGNNGHDVISFLRTSKTNSSTVDLLAILQFIENKGYFGNLTIQDVEYGVEATSGNETYNFGSYSINFN